MKPLSKEQQQNALKAFTGCDPARNKAIFALGVVHRITYFGAVSIAS